MCLHVDKKNWGWPSLMFGCPVSACLRGRTTDDLFFLLLLLNSLFVSQFIQYNGQLCLKCIQIILPNPLDLYGLNLLIYMAALIIFFFLMALLKSFPWAARFAWLPVSPFPGTCTLSSEAFWTLSLLTHDTHSHWTVQDMWINYLHTHTRCLSHLEQDN